VLFNFNLVKRASDNQHTSKTALEKLKEHHDCDPCGAGKYSAGGDACQDCPAGKSSPAGSDESGDAI